MKKRLTVNTKYIFYTGLSQFSSRQNAITVVFGKCWDFDMGEGPQEVDIITAGAHIEKENLIFKKKRR